MRRTTRRMDLPPTKTVTVYRNGDAFYPGRKVVVNPRQVSTFDNFLTILTKKIEAPFGAVRRLYTPTQGRKIQHLDELKHGNAYIAAGNEPFKTINYGITIMKPQNTTMKQIIPVTHSRIVASSRWKKVTDGVCTINVFTNGELLTTPARIRIPKHTLKSWENILSMVTEKANLRTGAVFKLCRLDGQTVSGPSELVNNQHYVAVGAEKFKPLPYEQFVPYRDLAKGNNTAEGQDILPDVEKKTPQKGAVCFKEDLEHAARGQMKEHTANMETDEQQRQVSKIPALLMAGESSVFNAQNKRSETAGAAEVQDDPQVKVDLPIEQVEARVVEEEHEEVEDVKASQDDSDTEFQQQSLDEGSPKGAKKTERTLKNELKTLIRQEDKEEEVSHGLGGIRSRMSRFFKGKMSI